MATKDDAFGGILRYFKGRYLDGVPSIPRTKDDLLMFLRQEGAWILHDHATRMEQTSRTATNADRMLRMQLAGRAKAIRAVGDLIKATIVQDEDIDAPVEVMYDDYDAADGDDYDDDDSQWRRPSNPRRRRDWPRR